MKDYITVIGGGLAGTEAAYQIAKRGIKVKLYDIYVLIFIIYSLDLKATSQLRFNLYYSIYLKKTL